MKASAIRELAASEDSSLIAAGQFCAYVQVWDCEGANLLREIETHYVSGAGNLALSGNGELLITGESKEKGVVAGYSVSTGKMLWKIRTKFPSKIRFTPQGSIIFSSADTETIEIDPKTARIIRVRAKTTAVFLSQFGSEVFRYSDGEYRSFRLALHGKEFAITSSRGTILDAAFSKDTVLIAESRGSVYCVESNAGLLRWSVKQGTDSHVVRLSFSPKNNSFSGVCFRYNEPTSRDLIRFKTSDGSCYCVIPLDSWAETFFAEGSKIVTSDGTIRLVEDGSVIGKLSFPSREYPD